MTTGRSEGGAEGGTDIVMVMRKRSWKWSDTADSGRLFVDAEQLPRASSAGLVASCRVAANVYAAVVAASDARCPAA